MSTLIENVDKVVAAHEALKTAISAKGVAVPDGAKLSDLPALVEGIEVDTAQDVPGVSFYAKLSGVVVLKLQPVVKADFTRTNSVSYCFYNCSSITSLTLPDGFGSSATSFVGCFQNCSSLTSLALPDDFGSSATSVISCFSGCKSLKNVTGAIKFSNSFILSSSTELTHESLVNIINGLVTVTSAKTLTLGSTNLAKLTDAEKAIATAKGWTLA